MLYNLKVGTKVVWDIKNTEPTSIRYLVLDQIKQNKVYTVTENLMGGYMTLEGCEYLHLKENFKEAPNQNI